MKNQLCFAMVFAIASCVGASAQAGVLTASGVHGSHYYELYAYQAGQAKNWAGANAAANSLSYYGETGHLATITSLGEDTFLNNLGISAGFPGTRQELWVGGVQRSNQATPGAGWEWVNGEGSIDATNAGPNYANWLGGEPNDLDGIENNRENHLAIRLRGNFGWNDEGNLGNIVGYVVEYEAVPEPASLAIFGIGGLGMIAGGIRRRRKQPSA